MGADVTTLADLLPVKSAIVCVGINPSVTSVAAGHYYQGPLGQRFFGRLRRAGLLPPKDRRFEDDAGVASGLAFTDVVKRPTARASGLRPGEMEYGAALLRDKLERVGPSAIICTYKASAEALIGRLIGNGWVDGRKVAGADIFVMPGPYEATGAVNATLAELALRLRPGWRVTTVSPDGHAEVVPRHPTRRTMPVNELHDEGKHERHGKWISRRIVRRWVGRIPPAEGS